MNPATVKEIIAILEKMPQDAPCYFRPKYSGGAKSWENIPVNKNGISEIHPENEEKNVTFLC